MADFDKEGARRAIQKLRQDDSWLVEERDPLDTAKSWETEPAPNLPPLQPEVPYSQQPAAYSSAPEPKYDPLVAEPPREVPPPPPEPMMSEPPPPPEPMMSEGPRSSEPPPPAETPRPAPAAKPAPRRAAPAPSAPAPAAPSAPVDPTADGIEDRPLNPGAKTRELQSNVAQADQRRIDLVREAGESIEATGAKEREIQDARSTTAADGIDAQKERAAAHKRESDDMKLRMETELADLKKQMGNPPTDTVGIIMGILSVAAAANGKEGAARAIQGLGQAMNGKMKKWQAGIEAGERNLEGMGKIATYDRLANADEDEAEALIGKATIAEFDSALDYAKANAKTDEQRRAADVMQNDLRQKADALELKRRSSAAAAARTREMNQRLANAKTEEEREHIANSYGDDGRKAYASMLKNNKGQVDIEGGLLGNQKTIADTQLAMAKAQKESGSGGPDVGPFEGYVTTRSLSPQIQAKLEPTATSNRQIQTQLDRLLALSEKYKSGQGSRLDPNDAREIEFIRDNLVGQFTQLYGKGSPTGEEYKNTIQNIADPQKIFQRADSYEVIRRMKVNTQQTAEASLAAMGVYREDHPKAQSFLSSGRAQSGGSGVVQVKDPSGQTISMPMTTFQALQKSGSGWELADDTASE